MKERYVFTAMILFSMVIGVSANPQILHYDYGHWYNDRNEEVNSNIVTSYNTISEYPNWVIEVITPQLHYREMVFDNGENITIVKGSTTITLTADTTTTLTVK